MKQEVEQQVTVAASGAPAEDSGLSLAETLQEQVGLRLEKTTAPVDIVVIDQAEELGELAEGQATEGGRNSESAHLNQNSSA